MAHPAPSPRVRTVRQPSRGAYDRATIDAILDAAMLSHLGFADDGQPYVIPTLHARDGDAVYVHGSSASRTLRALRTGIPACLTVTLLDGIVLARSVYEHSINYRSVVLLGTAEPVTETTEKLAALELLTDRMLPGRWAEARSPSPQELKATSVLRMPIDEASAKVRTGDPGDGDTPDAALDVWAGCVPVEVSWGEPVPDARLRDGIPVPASVHALRAAAPAHRP